MKVISPKAHGFLDYIVATILLVSPLLFDFAHNGPARWVPACLGIATIVYSLLTDYYLSLSHKISMRTHLVLDTINGLLLAASPWLFGFADHIWQPYLILGTIELLVILMTKTEPSPGRTREDKRIHRTAGVH